MTPSLSSPGTRSCTALCVPVATRTASNPSSLSFAGSLDRDAGLDLDADGGDVAYVVVHDLVRKAVGGDAERQEPTGALGLLVDLDAVALARQLPGGGEAGRARAHDGDLLAVLLGLVDGGDFVGALRGGLDLAVPLVGDEALEAADRQRALELAARALALARRVARAPEGADERRRLQDQVERLVVLAAAHACDVAVRLDARRALVGARRDAFAADDGLLGHRLREGDERRPPRHHVGVVLVRHGDVAGHLALAAAGAGGLVDELGLLLDPGEVAGGAVAVAVAAVAADGLHLGVGHHVDVGVVDGGAHLGRADAAGAVERGEDLAEQDHLAADARLLLDDQDLVAHVAELERRLHAADAAADDERVVVLASRSHAAAFPAGPSPARAAAYSCM